MTGLANANLVVRVIILVLPPLAILIGLLLRRRPKTRNDERFARSPSDRSER